MSAPFWQTHRLLFDEEILQAGDEFQISDGSWHAVPDLYQGIVKGARFSHVRRELDQSVKSDRLYITHNDPKAYRPGDIYCHSGSSFFWLRPVGKAAA